MSTASYSDSGFWAKLGSILRSAGKKVVEPALLLYYAAQRPETPAWAKSVVYGALAYLILPVDAVPDMLPVVGYTDDAGVLVSALTTIAAYVDQSVRSQTRAKLAEWFGGAQ